MRRRTRPGKTRKLSLFRFAMSILPIGDQERKNRTMEPLCCFRHPPIVDRISGVPKKLAQGSEDRNVAAVPGFVLPRTCFYVVVCALKKVVFVGASYVFFLAAPDDEPFFSRASNQTCLFLCFSFFLPFYFYGLFFASRHLA